MTDNMAVSHDSDLTRLIIGLAMHEHTGLGPGMQEHSYELCLCCELARNGIPFARQADMPQTYETVSLDLGYLPAASSVTRCCWNSNRSNTSSSCIIRNL